MNTDGAGRSAQERIMRIHAAFRAGDLVSLREAEQSGLREIAELLGVQEAQLG